MDNIKHRNGCLLFCLLCLIIINAFSIITYLVRIFEDPPNSPMWVLVFFFVKSLFELLCSLALFRWKKWGFWGILLSSVAGIIYNAYRGSILFALLITLLIVLPLWGALTIGGEHKGWTQLE
jgi:hypothetical protein